jgi:vacuolar-type H+-ATPase subunit H
MALDVITEIKAAEEKAQEIRRAAAAAAKDAIKRAAEECAQARESELLSFRKSNEAMVEAAGEAAKNELEAQSAERSKECEELKIKAEGNLSRAAEKCLERILR